jgi:Papain-like cysteine protease AvrRpt2
VPLDLEDLAIALNQLSPLPGMWRGIPVQIPTATDIELLQALNATGSWVAGFWEEGRPIGHAVVVDGFDIEARLFIRDPWGETVKARYGSRYIMELHSFLDVWSRFAAFYLNPSQPE